MKCIHRYSRVESLHSKISILGIVLLFLLFAIGSLNAQNQSKEVLKQQMAKIRQSTNWEDPVAAKKANDQIRELSKKLMMTGKPQVELPKGLSNEEAEEMYKDAVEYKMKLWGQMMKIAQEGGDWDLAKPLREEIVQEYKDDEDPTIKSPDWLQLMPYLLINMSMPHIDVIIDQMPAFKGIKKLIITCEKPGVSVNLSEILSNASEYPLEELYILNFGSGVTRLPSEIGHFSKLKILSVINNHLAELPSFISSLTNLTTLNADINPVSTVVEIVKPLKNLTQLGIAKTNLSETEINQIKQALPHCEIMTK